jgi:N-acetylmuramoyl-L-alanine amidase
MATESFIEWFATQKFRHFSAVEFTDYFTSERKGVKNSPPPKRLWRNIISTLRIADELRASFGKPCRILSSYRSPAYNRVVGGGVMSQHLDFTALDIAVDGIPARRVYERLLQWRKEGKFTGGLGYYPSSGFVHIDTRPRNATWWGS